MIFLLNSLFKLIFSYFFLRSFTGSCENYFYQIKLLSFFKHCLESLTDLFSFLCNQIDNADLLNFFVHRSGCWLDHSNAGLKVIDHGMGKSLIYILLRFGVKNYYYSDGLDFYLFYFCNKLH